MKKCNNEACNCDNCVWDRILSNSEKITLHTKRQLALKYSVENDKINWIALEQSLKIPYSQSKQEIIKCLDSRLKKLNPSLYPGTAQSYKWALLNHNKIWL